VLTCEKQLASVFWDTQEVLLINWLPHGMTLNSNTYCDSDSSVPQNSVAEEGRAKKVFFLHDNARPHSYKQIRTQLDELGYTVLPHPPYSSDLVPSNYTLFDKMYEPLRTMTFTDADALQGAVHQ
jgi:histone-lysine N-methyltransferase SETMAR